MEDVTSDDILSDIDYSDSPVIVDDDDEEVVAIDDIKADDKWHKELEEVLREDFVDQGIIKAICKCRNLPARYRARVWKICLNVASRADAMSSWDEKLDKSIPTELTEDCSKLVDVLVEEQKISGADVMEQSEVVKQAASVLTFYSKCRAVKYHSENGWTHILKPLLTLQLNRADLYNCFYAIQSRYIPRQDLSANVSAAPYHLLRLLLLYHDPEMCSFLDTCKISIQSFSARWFTTLFASHCSTAVVSAIWDIYVQKCDPFFILFLALVILLNSKEQVMTATGNLTEKDQMIETLSNAPSVLTVEDVDDFCQLASYYSDRTPSSFKRELGGCFYSGTMVASASKVDSIAADISQAFCLKVSVPELLLSSQPSQVTGSEDDGDGSKFRFFVVDCRPAQEYNKGHLLTAFHLDATLMLKEPTEFSAALSALFAAQEQAIQAGSTAGGEHLCFIGSGSDEDDQYMYMVIARLLQKHQSYVSVARGGYAVLIEYLSDVGIDLSEWIVGAERPSSSNQSSVTEKNSAPKGNGDVGSRAAMEGLVKKMAGNIFVKSMSLKDKVARFIENVDEEWKLQDRHVQTTDKGKPYRGTQSVFSIDDENEHDDDEDDDDDKQDATTISEQAIDELSTWTARSDTKHCFECQYVDPDGNLLPAHLLVAAEHMYCLLVVRGRKSRRTSKKVWVRALEPRRLAAIAKITSRRSFPELITFKFADPATIAGEEDPKIVAADKYIIPDAGTATKAIKYLIIEAESKTQNNEKPGTSGNTAVSE